MLSEAVKTRIEHLIDTRSVKFGAWLYRRTGGRITRLWRRRALLLTTTGRRTGLLRTVLVQFFPDREDFIVVAANSGLPVHPAWYLNLTAHPEALVEVEGRVLPVRAEQLSPDEADEFWPRVLAAAPDYARYRQRTDRAIPLLRLVPQQDVAMPNHDEMNVTVAPPTDGQGITSPPDRSGNHPGRSFHIWAVFWGSLVGLVFLAVTALTLTVWATDPRYAETSPITDVGFFALGMVIATGFLSQLRTDPPITGLHQGIVAAAALAAAGLLGSRIEPLVGGLVISAAFAVLAALHPVRRT